MPHLVACCFHLREYQSPLCGYKLTFPRRTRPDKKLQPSLITFPMKCYGSAPMRAYHASVRQWSLRDSNPSPPACKAGALPNELRPRGTGGSRTLGCVRSIVGFLMRPAFQPRSRYCTVQSAVGARRPLALHSVFPRRSVLTEWSTPVSNRSPLRCERSALPK